MPDIAQLKYQTSKTVNLDLLAVHGASEPDHVSKFPGITHEFLDGSLAEQIAGGRRNINIDFQVMTAINRRKIVDWWLDPLRQIVCLAAAPGSPQVSLINGGSLQAGSTYLFKISAVDAVGESAASTQVTTGVVGATDKTASLSWAAVTNARCYKIYGKEDAGAWQLLRYVLTTSDTIGGIWADEIFKTIDPLSSASVISVMTTNELEFTWAFETELARILSLELREASIFLSASGFPI